MASPRRAASASFRWLGQLRVAGPDDGLAARRGGLRRQRDPSEGGQSVPRSPISDPGAGLSRAPPRPSADTFESRPGTRHVPVGSSPLPPEPRHAGTAPSLQSPTSDTAPAHPDSRNPRPPRSLPGHTSRPGRGARQERHPSWGTAGADRSSQPAPRPYYPAAVDPVPTERAGWVRAPEHRHAPCLRGSSPDLASQSPQARTRSHAAPPVSPAGRRAASGYARSAPRSG